ncbi:hypothetical protein AGMMS49525_13350 [Bacteroidia bacterium]|nr:hypothetical protein AGMMS49525_13350 [Bacteroidia bacterium]
MKKNIFLIIALCTATSVTSATSNPPATTAGVTLDPVKITEIRLSYVPSDCCLPQVQQLVDKMLQGMLEDVEQLWFYHERIDFVLDAYAATPPAPGDVCLANWLDMYENDTWDKGLDLLIRHWNYISARQWGCNAEGLLAYAWTFYVLRGAAKGQLFDKAAMCWLFGQCMNIPINIEL